MAYRVLEVTLQSAKDLKRVNLISRMEVYAVVTISGDPLTRQCTQPDPYGGRHPSWNATFRFNVPPTAAAANGCLHVLLRTERALGDRDVGEVILPLADVLAGTTERDPRPRPQQCASYTVRKVHRFEPRGTLNVSYRLGPVVAPQPAPPPTPPPFYHPPYAAYLPQTLALPPPTAQASGHDHAVRQPAAYSQAAGGHGAGVHQPAPSAGATSAYGVPAYPQTAAGHGAGVHQPAPSAAANSAYGVPAYPQAAAGNSAGVHQPAPSAGGAIDTYDVTGYSSQAAAGHGAARQPTAPSGHGVPAYSQAAGGYAAVAPSPAKGNRVDGELEFGTGLGAGLVTGAISGMLASDAVAYSYGYRAGLADGGAAVYTYKNSHVPTKVQDKVETNRKMV
ncbi:hypothetical protein EJB05_10594, partial [Eragrostis curvula]